MVLSNELLSDFAKITKNDKNTRNETTIYGTISKYNGGTYVKFDGSELLTPVITTADVEDGERVTVLLKNHSATVTGNISSPAARTGTVTTVTNDVQKMNTVLADTVRTGTFEAEIGKINGSLSANSASIGTLTSDNADIKNRLTAAEATIKNLTVEDKITTEYLDATYANISFSNIGKAAIESFYSKSGLIQNVVVGDGTITGKLVGVTISGDLIEANTLVANKLVIKGTDGLYYKLNTDGVKTEAEQTAYNSLNGSVILAKSITATKINVSDLVAFGATIGGYHITNNSLYSGVKSSIANTTRGVYLDTDGQIAFGDASNFVKYYKDTDGTYKLKIAANAITFGVNNTNVETAINSAKTAASNAQSSVDSLVIGGRNLLLNSSFSENIDKWTRNGSSTMATMDGYGCVKFTPTLNGTYFISQSILDKVEPGETYTGSAWIKAVGITQGTTNYYFRMYNTGSYDNNGTATWFGYSSKGIPITTEEWQFISYTITTDDKLKTATRFEFQVYMRDFTGEVYIRNAKLEKGTKPTDWTPAPEDTDAELDALDERVTTAQSSATAAAKTATDYMNLSSAGLVVGQNPASPTAGNTLISTDGVSIRKGTTVLAAFKAASRTASGITSATLTSSDSTDSESDGVTRVNGTIKKNETRANIYITTNGNPVYFPKGLETDKVLINNEGIILNDNIVIDGSIVDNSGEGILTPLNSYGNMIIGHGRYQDGGSTHVYGTRVKAKTKSGFSASVNGKAAIETDNSSGNATFGWHHYENSSGETNVYGNIVSLVSKGDIRINPEGNFVRVDGGIVPYTTNAYNLGAASLAFANVYASVSGANKGYRICSGTSSYNAIGTNADGTIIYGNTDYCTNIVTKSTSTSSTGYSFKVTCGNNPALTIDDNDARLLLYGGTDSTSRYLGSMAVYKRTYSAAANVYVTSSGMIGRSTSSSRRYKKDITDLPLDVVRRMYDLPVRQFKYNDDSIAPDDERYGIDIPGFIAEEVAEYLPVACDHIRDSNGDLIPEMWNSKIIIPALLKLIQDLNNRITNLEEKGA